MEGLVDVLIVDSHLDLAFNALFYNRELKRPVAETRALEAGMPEAGRGGGTVALPEMRRGRVALCFATLFGRVSDRWREGSALDASAPEIGYARAHGQLAYYRLLEAQGELRQIRTRRELDAHLAEWQEGAAERPPIGFVLVMEGADPILSPDQVQAWWDEGLRAVSLAHYGVSSYAHGTGTDGGLLERGPALLRAARSVGMMLDLTHLADRAFWEALERFDGPVHTSHSNCRALVTGQRQMSDAMLRAIIERNGVIGAACEAWMLYPGWVQGETSPEVVSLSDLVDHMDHVCQLAGNADHAGLGTDLDGGFGKERTPHDLDTIADLQRIPALLSDRGYADTDIAKLMHGNWVRLLRRALPQS